MFNVTVSTTMDKGHPIIKDENTYTPAQAIADAGYSNLRGSWMMDGTVLSPIELTKPFAELRVGAAFGRTRVSLANVAKADNAIA